MSVFQEEWVKRGMAVDEEKDTPIEVEMSMGYAAVGIAECLEETDKAEERMVTENLKVRKTSSTSLHLANEVLLVDSSCCGVGGAGPHSGGSSSGRRLDHPGSP
jgi:hypothetical protein